MSHYTQLSLEERCSIARLHEAGQSIRQIAATLDRQPSTVGRELKRNTGNKIGYQPAFSQRLKFILSACLAGSRRAQAQASARCWTGWEADCMLVSSPGPAILIAHERHSRITIALPQMRLSADNIANSLTRLLAPVAPRLRQSITFDNLVLSACEAVEGGTEFSRHQRIASQLGIKAYFCDPRAPWQKGGIENAIGRLRRALPTETDLAALPQTQLNAIVANYNNTPRKCLGFLTPAEIFNPLHFKCESTPVSNTGRRGENG